ncbi:uncharacterized protein CC84DRAFT_1190701 [Paraphaeosphaeria sporulosa]|uniref:SnoaL-like domain-containing protein n=1 Tax=Paraphaeosphaeria sporulosa TaxID=1460663 RepID=A0A177BZD3_9PLEO|nr:uncharacterized protein CC84DRAFT_1190701 [Paraphaeosphaeria sporulosa]OAG00743.1 hypothetical protein CC84DRAFT_1190701 [Paraphaeosphaeria sporulosa]
MKPTILLLGAHKDTAKAVIDGYNAWNIDRILAYRRPGFQHQVLASSMGRTAKSNDENRAYLTTIMPLYSNFTLSAFRTRITGLWLKRPQVTVLEEIYDAETHTCIIHASSKAETEIGQYGNEYALILTFTEDGKHVTRFEEFVDSAYSERFVAALAKATSSQ